MLIFIIIPTFNRKECLRTLLVQLRSQITSSFFIKIAVVVDGSTDGTLEMLEKEFPETHVVKGTGEWWYTRSLNEGFKYSATFKPDFLLTLNDDIEVGDNYVQELFNAADKLPKNSIIGSVSFTMKKPHRVTSSGVKKILPFIGKSIEYHKFGKEIDPNTMFGIYPTEVLPGRGTFIPAEVLQELNYFDGYFKQYLSDYDFCLRAEKNGYDIYISWNARVFSHVEKTSSSSSFTKFSLDIYLSSFINPYSRNYIPQRIKYFWRHRIKFFLPLYIFIWLCAVTRANLCKKGIL